MFEDFVVVCISMRDTETLETESIGGVGQKVWSVSVNEMPAKPDRIQVLSADGQHVTAITFRATSSTSPQTSQKVLVSTCRPFGDFIVELLLSATVSSL